MNIQNKENQFASEVIKLPDDRNLFVIVGGNNSGKSTFLRSVSKSYLENSRLINVNRTVLDGEGPLSKNYQDNRVGFNNTSKQATSDNEKPQTQALQEYFSLKDVERKPIIDWYNKHFPNQLYEEREDPENLASSMFLKINGHSITKQGSGMRSTFEIFIKLFDPAVEILCIDEPELGLEPQLQRFLFQAIKEKATGTKKIFISTHSHHFLDYEDVANNFICKRNSDNLISIETVQDLKPVIFRLLGNTLSSLLLPENIIILEGGSDTTILSASLKLLKKQNYQIHNADADANIKFAINSITQFLTYNKRIDSVYLNNIYVIADVAKDSVIRLWQKLLPDSKRQLKILPKNGIEYFYPERVVQEVFQSTEPVPTIIDEYLASNDNVFNGVRISKIELAKKVGERLTIEDLDDVKNELFVFIKTLPQG